MSDDLEHNSREGPTGTCFSCNGAQLTMTQQTIERDADEERKSE